MLLLFKLSVSVCVRLPVEAKRRSRYRGPVKFQRNISLGWLIKNCQRRMNNR